MQRDQALDVDGFGDIQPAQALLDLGDHPRMILPDRAVMLPDTHIDVVRGQVFQVNLHLRRMDAERDFLLLDHAGAQHVTFGSHAVEQLLERIDEQIHAVDLKLPSHIIQINADFDQHIERLLRFLQPLFERFADRAVIAGTVRAFPAAAC